jgi:hypothetical protein
VERHFGKPTAETIGTSFWQHYPEEESVERDCLLHDAMARRRTMTARRCR